ncbi:hypothetical protein C8Q79DRAFT_1012907 [Trametes meyenii]|nr:hypothetical protein C8Q79DRAFT_1012907 [Trametes meyenii]
MAYYGDRGTGSGYRKSNRNNGSGRAQLLPADRYIKGGLKSRPLRTLDKPQATETRGSRGIQPENLKYLGSYNWVEEEAPTIIVPGSPPVWQERALPYHVPYDKGIRMIDQNGFRMGPASCLLPLFRAVDIVAEDNGDTSHEWSDVDVVTDRNGLRKLIRWLNHSGSDHDEPPREFRIDLQLGGNKTVLMHRWEKRTREIAAPPKSGCGISFERETTSPAQGCTRGTGHHRIVKYDFGGLKMVVRFEVDACTAPQPTSTTATRRASATASQAPPRRSTDNDAPNVDSLAEVLAGLGVSSTAVDPTPSPNTAASMVSVIRAGTQVPQDAIVELVTRADRFVHQFDWEEKYPQLLLSYTPHLFLGIHNRGLFDRVEKYSLGGAELRHVESDPNIQATFRRLVSVLRTIQNLVKEHGKRGRLTLVCQNGVLGVYERTTDAGVLPDAELLRFGALGL